MAVNLFQAIGENGDGESADSSCFGEACPRRRQGTFAGALPPNDPRGSRPIDSATLHPGLRRRAEARESAIKSKRGRLQAMPSRTHGRPWPCEWVARSAGMERSGRFRRAQPEPDGYCNSHGCACEAHYRTHLRRNSFIPAAKVKSQCRARWDVKVIL